MSFLSTGHDRKPNRVWSPEDHLDPEEYFTKEQLVEYFCKRIQPKLSELDEFKTKDVRFARCSLLNINLTAI